MWIKWIAVFVVLIIVCWGMAAIYGHYRWQSDTDKLRARLINGQRAIQPKIYDQKEIEGLPVPVQRFFRTVLKDGQPIVARVKLSQRGQFNMVLWEAINNSSAQGTLTDRSTTVSLVFRFNPEGLIDSTYAAARYRDKLTAMPWSGRFWDYSVCNGMVIPLAGEVGWVYPEGIRLYFKGRFTDVNYEFASS